MSHPTHRSPHSRIDEEDEQEPGHLPIEPDDGQPPPGMANIPEEDGIVDPEV